MKSYRIRQSELKGRAVIPSSKSHTMRAILFGAMAKGQSRIHHYLQSNDTLAMIDACRLFGAKIDVAPEVITITGVDGKIRFVEDVINAGNSGIVLRFCAAIGALGHLPVVITGDHSIRHQRPMHPLIDGLTQLGVSVKTLRGDGYAPLIIEGPIVSGSVVIDGEDSQPVSALLIAGAFSEGLIELRVRNPGEKPWVALTLDWFDRLGVGYERQGYDYYRLDGRASYEGFEYSVPGDFSSAAFPIAAALITNSELVLHNIDMEDSQGDKELISVLKRMGGNIEIDHRNKNVIVRKGSALNGIKVDINNFVDAITILAVVGCYAEGETHIHNAAVAKGKECNRIACIVKELRKMGADIEELDDGLIVRKSSLIGAEVDTHSDHRMGMSLSVAGLGAKGITSIRSIDCISKTFPSFAADFTGLGACIEVLQ